MAPRTIKSCNHHKSERTEYVGVGFLWLLGGALLVLTPYYAEAFPLFQHSSSSSGPTAAFTNRLHDSRLIKTNDSRFPRRFYSPPSSILASAPTPSTYLSAHYLTTALEGLWEDRIANGDSDKKDDYQSLVWLDLELNLHLDSNSEDGRGAPTASSSTSRTSTKANTSLDKTSRNQDQHESKSVTLPLYPLSETYLPLSTTATDPHKIVNHTLNNVEPQNIKMALDLLSEKSSSRRFCVVLRAMDTGRIATVGTILRITDADVQKLAGATENIDDDTRSGEEDNSKIARIRLTCKSEGLAEILEVENGSGWRAKRLLRSNEYLRARLRPLMVADDRENNDNLGGTRDWRDSYKAIREDLRIIKLIYQLQLGSEDYPPNTLSQLGNAIQDFPELDACVEDDDALLWSLAQEWQSVCATLRQGRQALLATERNELMVAAASAGGGPLKLPIHLSDLDPDSRKEIQKLDQHFQKDHEVSGMDPILDFQVLIGLPTTNRRFCFLAKLVSRERLRLQDIASSQTRRR